MADPSVCCYLTKLLCAQGGRMALDALLGEIALSEEQLCEVLKAAGPDRFVLLDTGAVRAVVATTRARVCRRKFCQRPCENLHLCKLNLLGRCNYSHADRSASQENPALGSRALSAQPGPFPSPPPNSVSLEALAGLEPAAPPPHRRDVPYRGRSKSRDRTLKDSQEFLPPARDSSLNSCAADHEKVSRRSSLDDDDDDDHDYDSDGAMEALTHKLLHLGSRHSSPPPLVSTKATGPASQKGANFTLSENDSREGLFYGRSGSTHLVPGSTPASIWKECTSGVDSLGIWGGGAFPPNPPVPLPQKSLSMLSSDIKAGNGNQVPFLNRVDRVTTDLSPTGPPSYKATASREQEESLSKDQDPRPIPRAPLGTGKIPEDGAAVVSKNEYIASKTYWSNKYAPNLGNEPLKVERETEQREKMGGPSLSSRGDQDALPYGIQNLLSQDLPTPGKVTVSAQATSPPTASSSSSSRAAAVGVSAHSTAHTPTTTASRLKSNPATASSSSSSRAAAIGVSGHSTAHTPMTTASRLKSSRTHDLAPYPNSSVTSLSSSKRDGGSKEICLDYLQECCQEVNCSKVHFYLPFKWQMLEVENTWIDLPHMKIEKAYCNPNIFNFSVMDYHIDFQTMTCNSKLLRRLSTPSSGTKLTSLVFATQWVWYWRSRSDIWVKYGEKSSNQGISNISSSYIEDMFLAYPKGIVPFKAGFEAYELSFQAMIQTNVLSRTQKHVLRRPKFLSSSDLELLKIRRNCQPALSLPTPNASQQDRPQRPSAYTLSPISDQHPEYIVISASFKASMKNFKIEKIQRIHNPALLTAFQRKKVFMRNANEKTLFHATDRRYVESICQHNFDWSLHGTCEAKYGKGNYFTKEAISSHKNCLVDNQNRVMLVSQVLVGDYTEGKVVYTRPPSKGYESTLYDSCVDTRLNPSIFVIFQKDQIYPQYVIDYSETDKACVIS
ncbi:zinc finger CCCH-type antiviral protein 1 [Echinops telfairi]|uniref:Zinc finger CCCH-type antiviral protein 1 n=1 Tax=Echinops telfairi TaxID=9371 RepID=A0AC55CZE1_ECHTE|nr:zinc finger CCCH-type antiviral protein 1 [Echinops telfairi]